MHLFAGHDSNTFSWLGFTSRHRSHLRARPQLNNGDLEGDGCGKVVEGRREEDLPAQILPGQRHSALRPRGLQLDLGGPTGIRSHYNGLYTSRVMYTRRTVGETNLYDKKIFTKRFDNIFWSHQVWTLWKLPNQSSVRLLPH